MTKLALPEGGVSLESSQLGESQAALGIWGREGGLGEWGKQRVRHCPLSTNPCGQAAMFLQHPLVVPDHC